MPDGKTNPGTPAKWAALVDDRVVWAPNRNVPVSLLKTQGNVGAGRVLVQDCNSAQDVVLKGDVTINLALGNVFYTLAEEDLQSRAACEAAPKLAFFIDDRPVVTTRGDQTGKSLRELFLIPEHAKLVRDHVGEQDERIDLGDKVNFRDGPVFHARAGEAVAPEVVPLSITVNARQFTEREGVRPDMTGLQIAALAYGPKAREVSVSLASEGGREVGLAQQIRIKGGEVFDATHRPPSGNVGTF
jgi:hypothetical protein